MLILFNILVLEHEPSFTLSISGQAVSLIQENEYESYYRVAKDDLANLELNLTDDEYAGGIYFQVRGVSQDGNDEARTHLRVCLCSSHSSS